ncbi:DUF1616 domain-containing protein [Candidatus Bathyarchaeota archaeon]|nr:DUF1616 domain-containing protein [Candidatus Bathyarchaeota archaeon]
MLKQSRSRWLLSVISYTAITMLATYLIPEGSPLPLMSFRFVLGFIFVSFIPGYCMFHVLFPKKDEVNIVEKIVLSAALSFGITGIIGLFLGTTGIGLSFSSVTVSLSTVVLILALLAFMRAAS